MIFEWFSSRSIILLTITLLRDSICGLSFALQGVAIMIVKEGTGFRYHGYLIFVVALYDFY